MKKIVFYLTTIFLCSPLLSMESDVVAFQKSTHAARSRDTTHHRQRDP